MDDIYNLRYSETHPLWVIICFLLSPSICINVLIQIGHKTSLWPLPDHCHTGGWIWHQNQVCHDGILGPPLETNISISFLSISSLPRKLSFSPYIGQLLQSALIMKVHPSSSGATPERKMFAFGHCSHLFTQAAVVEWNQQVPTQYTRAKKLCWRCSLCPRSNLLLSSKMQANIRRINPSL